MVKIRLSRTGKKNNPSFRVVVIDQHSKRESKAIEIIGHFSALTKQYNIDTERAKYWISVGAQPSDTVRRLLVKESLVEALPKQEFKKEAGKKSQDRKKASEAKAEAKKAAAAAPASKPVVEEAASEEPAAEATNEEAPATEETTEAA